jgi:hypothetical protein
LNEPFQEVYSSYVLKLHYELVCKLESWVIPTLVQKVRKYLITYFPPQLLRKANNLRGIN